MYKEKSFHDYKICDIIQMHSISFAYKIIIKRCLRELNYNCKLIKKLFQINYSFQ